MYLYSSFVVGCFYSTSFIYQLFWFDRFLSRSDSVTVSVWNNRKVNRREGAGFLGCVTLAPTAVSRLKDTGCKCGL